MSGASSLPTTRNEAWGFYGTMASQAEGVPTDVAWDVAMMNIADVTGASLDEVRAFLDSRYGRQYADDVSGNVFKGSPLLDAVRLATARWMAWKIDARTNRFLGIPVGLPYLTGFVHHAAIEDGEG